VRLKVDQLASHLNNKGLAPVYFITGEELLQINEAGDLIRSHAREQGFSDRQVFTVEPGFDWEALLTASNSLSLFSERRLLELRIPTGKPGDKGSKALLEYAQRPPEDTVLLIISGKLDKSSQSTKWFKGLDKAGVVIQVWPVSTEYMPGWIARRMRAKNLEPTPDAVALLAERVEGNLLAAAQEIEKLRLLHGSGVIDLKAVSDSVADSARYDIYGLADVALSGDAIRTNRIINGLKGEGFEPVLILWALTRDIRSMSRLAHDVEIGAPVEQALFKHKVWEKRKPLFKKGLQRYTSIQWRQLLCRAGRVDRVIKGVETGNAWDELLQLSLQITGLKLFSNAV
jgi:DNA polymerase-3 subunit delta